MSAPARGLAQGALLVRWFVLLTSDAYRYLTVEQL